MSASADVLTEINSEMAESSKSDDRAVRWEARRLLPPLRSLVAPLLELEQHVDASARRGSASAGRNRAPAPAEGIAKRGAVLAA